MALELQYAGNVIPKLLSIAKQKPEIEPSTDNDEYQNRRQAQCCMFVKDKLNRNDPFSDDINLESSRGESLRSDSDDEEEGGSQKRFDALQRSSKGVIVGRVDTPAAIMYHGDQRWLFSLGDIIKVSCSWMRF
tara:strand:+ start:114 stop:512 length:399 start_codon:yes stop_codon:yes gene_type:complete